MPTILLHIHGLPPLRVEAEAAGVGILQSVSPTFRIVLFTEFPVFQSVRRFSWPVEHVPPPEHQARIAGVTAHARYVEQRIELAQRHYRNVTVVHVDGASSAVDQIAEVIGRPELAALAHTLAVTDLSKDPGDSRWDVVLEGLRTAEAGRFTSAEGGAHISCAGPLRGAVLITGTLVGDSVGDNWEKPSWLSSIVVEFDADSSFAFESHVYASLSRLLGGDLAVVHPWRRSAVLSEDALHWVDLALEASTPGFRVLEEFLEMYELLTGSAMLDWNQARRYGAVRRLSRTASRRRVAGSAVPPIEW